MDRFGLRRFRHAQDFGEYEKALEEVKAGRKRTHWIWYIFPQIKGIPGTHSHNALFYSISCADEAREYLADDILGSRLREITQALLDSDKATALEIFGDIDTMKVRSSMTLFNYVSPDDIFGKVLKKYFVNSPDLVSLDLIRRLRPRQQTPHNKQE